MDTTNYTEVPTFLELVFNNFKEYSDYFKVKKLSNYGLEIVGGYKELKSQYPKDSLFFIVTEVQGKKRVSTIQIVIPFE